MNSPNAGFKSLRIYLVFCVSIVTTSCTSAYPKENQFYVTTFCIICNYDVSDVFQSNTLASQWRKLREDIVKNQSSPEQQMTCGILLVRKISQNQFFSIMNLLV